jgi:hypothetical protein
VERNKNDKIKMQRSVLLYATYGNVTQTPNAQRQTPNAQRQTPNAQRLTLNAKCLTPHASCFTLKS